MAIDIELRKKSGKRNLPESELRTHCVSVRLNTAELAALDKIRRKFQRGETLRMISFSRLPTPVIVPEINRELATNIGRSFGNLATLATAMRGGEYVPLDQIKTALADLQLSLIGGAS